ncbi:hypothetical protein [Rhizomicrobium electricum]|jgi:hypothetical protein|uniref:Uncharacterized protein n=1 Tax=Rhizomicrobium electricum TaxID=480070 RepID=A0ABP3PKQ3_9PROT|nr:hypothetical protein [Rhizomicrobium electricum]NIJ47186.1 hypothetical protein [Rhizomicrobium electricum]
MRRLLLAVSVFAALAVPASSAIPAGSQAQVASISRNHNDGSEYVWRVFCNSGLQYSLIPASQFPNSTRFEEVATPQTGDIAWWPEFVAIYVAQNQSLITPAGMVKLADLSADGNSPHFYRMRVLTGEEPGAKPAPGSCERNIILGTP